MRKIRGLLVVAMLVATVAPAVAQAQVEAPAWGGATVVERLVGWIGGLWTAVAGSEISSAAPVGGDEAGGVGPEGAGDMVTSPLPPPETEVYPEFDPNG